MEQCEIILAHVTRGKLTDSYVSRLSHKISCAQCVIETWLLSLPKPWWEIAIHTLPSGKKEVPRSFKICPCGNLIFLKYLLHWHTYNYTTPWRGLGHAPALSLWKLRARCGTCLRILWLHVWTPWLCAVLSAFHFPSWSFPTCRTPWLLLTIHFWPILQPDSSPSFHSQPLWPTASLSLSTISFHHPTPTIPSTYPFISSTLTPWQAFQLSCSSSNPAGTFEPLGPVPCYFLCLGLCSSDLAPSNTSLAPLCLKY